MEAAHASPPTDRPARSHSSERTCLVTGEARPKEDLIRFVVSPGRSVTPDLAQNLPGRGLWVLAERKAIETAAGKNLFSKAAKAPVNADPGLADIVAQLLHKRCLEFVGLARRAGIAVLGQPQVEAALKNGKLALLLIAGDAGQTLDNRRNVPENRSFTRDDLGAALGHDHIVYAGLKPHSLTVKLMSELARLKKISKTPSETDRTEQ